MSEYTPTTEEVAEIYFQSGYMTTPEQFDRWLAEVKAQVWEEAYMTGVSDVIADKGATMNPYRKEENNG